MILYLALCSIACLAGCSRYSMNDFIPARSTFSEEDCYEIRLAKMIISYGKMDKNDKYATLNSVEVYRGNNFQCARFLCWILEDDQSLRKKVLKQWLNIQKLNGSLPPIENIMPRIREIVSFDMDMERRSRRIKEFMEIYHSMNDTKWHPRWGKKYVSDLSNGHEAEIIQPLIDPGEPMCLTIFSPDMGKVKKALEQCANMNSVETTNADGVVVSGNIRSATIYDAIMRIGSGLHRKMLTCPHSLHQ